jgi:hypothetical protein
MMAENHQIQPSSSHFDNLKFSSSNYNRCIVEQNIRINEKREIKKLSQKEKNQAISKKNNLYHPKFNHFQVKLYEPNKSEQE